VTPYPFAPPETISVEIAGRDARFPVRRIFCVGRNYAAHVREMGFDPDREEPCYFTKSSFAVVPSGARIPYPPGTADFHHEVELVVAIGTAGFEVPADDALSVVFGYACGLDMTRRDLQIASRKQQGPWDIGKDFDNAAVLSTIRPAEDIGHPASGRIRLAVNGETCQDSNIANLICSVPEIIAHLSCYYRLQPGDLVFTGTPDGVGPVFAGDRIEADIEGIASLLLHID
jgi:fumarylpyruvate hydrolase